MCGIAGRFIFNNANFDKLREEKLAKCALVAMHHRGPDDEGYFADSKNGVWLASTRLKIIDLSDRAHQPMVSSNGRYTLVFNGEIYNYKQLKAKYVSNYPYKSDSDTEVLLALFSKYQEKCLFYLRGMFAFAIWDDLKKQLFLARDRLGKKPIRYCVTPSYFAFASEMSALSQISTFSWKPDLAAIGDFLTLGFVPSPRSGIEGIYKLPPAHFMTISAEAKVSINRYWDINYSNKWYLKGNEWVNRLTQSLLESVALRLQSDVPLAVHLSGGIDSSIVCAVASTMQAKPLNTLSVGYKDAPHDELVQAAHVAHYLGTNHREVIVSPDDIQMLPSIIAHTGELLSDPSVLPTWFLCKASKRIATVALNGDGGDEVFAGYYRYLLLRAYPLLKAFPFKKFLGSIFSQLNRYVPNSLCMRMKRILSLPYQTRDEFYLELIRFATSVKTREMVTARLQSVLTDQMGKQEAILAKFSQGGKNMDGYTHFDSGMYLPDDLLSKSDLISMAHSVEARSPLLDHHVVELSSHMPSSVRFGLVNNKPMLRKIAKRFLPSQLLNFGKVPFVPPIANWFRSDSRFLENELLDSNSMLAEYVNLPYVQRFILEHKKNVADHSYTLWTLLTLKYWLEHWFG